MELMLGGQNDSANIQTHELLIKYTIIQNGGLLASCSATCAVTDLNVAQSTNACN